MNNCEDLRKTNTH